MKTYYWIDYSFVTNEIKDWLVSHGMYFSNSAGLWLVKLEDIDANYFKLKYDSLCQLKEFKYDK